MALPHFYLSVRIGNPPQRGRKPGRSMKLGLMILALVVTLGLIAAPARADAYDDGVTALHAGEFQRAYDLWWPLALAGDCRAQYAVVELLQGALPLFSDKDRFRAWKDLVRPLDAVQRRRLIRQLTWRAAEQGHPAAQKDVAFEYFRLPGQDNYWIGREWMERAANRGYPPALRETIDHHYVRLNAEQAYYWLLIVERFGRLSQVGLDTKAEMRAALTMRKIRRAERAAAAWRPEMPLCPSDGYELE